MYLAPHPITETGVNHLMPLQGPLAGEIRGDNNGLEVSIVIAGDAGVRLPEFILDQSRNFGWLHSLAPTILSIG